MSAPIITLIVAVADSGVIGRDNGLPWHLPEDLKRFKRLTMGKPMVMGRRTFESIGKPLPGRTTVVITRDRDWRAEGVDVAHSLDEALRVAASYDGDTVIGGGAQVYAAAMPVLTHQVLTEVHLSPEGDTFYPEFDPAEWRETRRVSRPDLDWVWWERVTD